jgi:hypothetical protein
MRLTITDQCNNEILDELEHQGNVRAYTGGPGMTISVRIEYINDVKDWIFFTPMEALEFDDEEMYVMSVKDGVKIGRDLGDNLFGYYFDRVQGDCGSDRLAEHRADGLVNRIVDEIANLYTIRFKEFKRDYAGDNLEVLDL